jgi:hypothetical protein
VPSECGNEIEFTTESAAGLVLSQIPMMTSNFDFNHAEAEVPSMVMLRAEASELEAEALKLEFGKKR